MANVFAPFGFRQVSGLGSAPTYELGTALIAYDNTGKIFTGDPVVYVTGTPTGYIKQATASTVAILGVFAGCKYLSTSQKRTVWSSYWPGADCTTDVTAYVITDPNAQFVVQTGNTNTTAVAVGTSKIGQLINLATAVDSASGIGGSVGSTASGQSAMYADAYTIGSTDTLPFMIRNVVTDPPGANGTDLTTPYNWIIVGMNNAMFQGGGARTGIT